MRKLIRVKEWTYADDAHLQGLKECEFDEFHQDALIKELVKNKYVICGDTHQCSEFKCVPIFNDGYLILTMRRWAEIMEEAYFQMNPLKYPKPWFYMAGTCIIEENTP